MISSSAQAAKNVLRKELKSRLAAMTAEDRSRQSHIVAEKVMNSPIYKSSNRICIYLSMDEEVSTMDILKDIFATGKTCFVPRYSKTDMEMLRLDSWQDYQNLPLTAWNIRQPAAGCQGRDEALSSGGLDLIIVPGLGFTKDGKRLGRGKGYYDRYLAKCATVSKNYATLGLAFKQQILPDIPTDERDEIIKTVFFADD